MIDVSLRRRRPHLHSFDRDVVVIELIYQSSVRSHVLSLGIYPMLVLVFAIRQYDFRPYR